MNGREKVLLVIVDLKKRTDWPASEVAQEMEELVNACNAEVVERVVCPLREISAAHLIGRGKVEEIAALCPLRNIDTVVFSHDLKGVQQRNLEEAFKTKTVDRTQLILDIFARRAKSQEGKMQVELAQLQYLMPRLVGKRSDLSRLGGGIGTSGPGETKLEIDRRRIGTRIDKLSRELKEMALDRKTKRKKRKDRGIPMISLVGYTNAGKSTLLNTLTQAEQKTQNALFTTLDSLSRQLVLPNQQTVIVSDTVGFIHDLPHHLVEAFKATLEEVQEADILLHVLDVTHPNFRNFYDAVIAVLKELEVENKTNIVVLNKIDRLSDKALLEDLKTSFHQSVGISALTGENIPELLERISELISSRIVDVDLELPLDRMDLVNLIHKEGKVHSIDYSGSVIHVKATVPLAIARKLQ